MENAVPCTAMLPTVPGAVPVLLIARVTEFRLPSAALGKEITPLSFSDMLASGKTAKKANCGPMPTAVSLKELVSIRSCPCATPGADDVNAMVKLTLCCGDKVNGNTGTSGSRNEAPLSVIVEILLSASPVFVTFMIAVHDAPTCALPRSKIGRAHV